MYLMRNFLPKSSVLTLKEWKQNVENLLKRGFYNKRRMENLKKGESTQKSIQKQKTCNHKSVYAEAVRSICEDFNFSMY